ncbi:MAG: amidohydrolase family protein [Cyclobacteriaceae bacterium]|nr:amidohydrolase family protein [Cyclobacteriaceae bacterium]
MRIDSHQHFWIYDRKRDSWITDNMQVIQRDFLPPDLEPLLHQHNLHGCVAVQADQSETETNFLIALSEEHRFVRGVVGWTDLKAADVEAKLSGFKNFKALKGFRHIIQAEAKGFMLHPDFIRGVQLLKKYNFTYDILIREQQLEEALAFIQLLPDQKLVIDHIAKPLIGHDRSYWKQYITEIARYENVYCKLSGMVTEADWSTWQASNFTPYLDTIFHVFGSKRVMYGSDWPVCLLAASYSRQLQIVEQHIQSFSDTEKQAIMGENATGFYNL